MLLEIFIIKGNKNSKIPGSYESGLFLKYYKKFPGFVQMHIFRGFFIASFGNTVHHTGR